MLSNPTSQPNFGLITNGHEFLFLKAARQPAAIYNNSKLFSLFNPGDELYTILKILKQLAREITVEG